MALSPPVQTQALKRRPIALGHTVGKLGLQIRKSMCFLLNYTTSHLYVLRHLGMFMAQRQYIFNFRALSVHADGTLINHLANSFTVKDRA